MYSLSKTSKNNDDTISIILPTYNESKNIIQIIESIRENLPKYLKYETIIVDDNSPDGTGKIVEDYIKSFKDVANQSIKLIHRTTKNGLSSAIIKGIQQSSGETIVVMDSDFSHPPQIIPKMLETLRKYQYDVVIASRYVSGGKIKDWTLKRKVISKFATKIAKFSLKVSVNDPMSGFFIFKKNIINGLHFDGLGFKILLELIVKTKDVKIKEVPYTFTDRKFGSSKLDTKTIFDFGKSVFKLYRYGKQFSKNETRKSIKFISKAGRFYTVGASGFIVNYIVSLFLSNNIPELWYVQANVFGILASIISNFILNKTWTFEDKDFKPRKTITQFTKFLTFSSIGAAIQLGMVFSLVDNYQLDYPIVLLLAVLSAAFGNFILNKKFTFKEKTWC
ncbi:glycosyltransferase family 2 protein [Candidatus Nitrosopumilus sp. SW]|uniref:glycosyltransferase n=1 Tax=Candidatus Nitrosopumilus sp. SW TaxID=2508726 RepID=UPI00114E716B|nr:glycosyltransferase family 2 protein [Candidatus Nitrosopumilus sp. SW]QDI89698.1 glycosyltransferase family 2 protein [Candidatus Nitrosopumilus sp. SW]